MLGVLDVWRLVCFAVAIFSMGFFYFAYKNYVPRGGDVERGNVFSVMAATSGVFAGTFLLEFALSAFNVI